MRAETERGPRAGAAQHERADDEQFLEQAVAHQQHDRRAEPERSDREARDPRRAASQDPVPDPGGGDGDAGQRDQAARELLDCDDDREAEPAEAEQQGGDRREPPARS